jgi:solute carrier family 26 (sodium-independent sulfate anion transporter), member 11
MASTSTKVGHFLAKILGIRLNGPNPPPEEDVTRGESVFSIQTTETFVEEPPTTVEYFKEFFPTRNGVLAYLKSLFPFLSWIGLYNLQWAAGDLVAGTYPPALHGSFVLTPSRRHHDWRCCRASGHGICVAGQS